MKRVAPGWIVRFVALALVWSCATAGLAQSPDYSRIEADTIKDRLHLYKGKDAKRRITLTRLFEEVGCKDNHLDLQQIRKADAPNVICTLPGSTDEVIVVGAHFDRVDKGDGVADNWSGASMLPSLYQSLSAIQRKHTFVFAGFSDEEEGYVGSRFYVAHLTEEQRMSIKAMVNLDTLGLESTRVWASNSDPDLVSLINEVALSMQLPIDVMNVDKYGNSDGISFQERDVPVITLHSITKENIKILHSDRDTFSEIRLDDYYDTYNLVSEFLSTLDQK